MALIWIALTALLLATDCLLTRQRWQRAQIAFEDMRTAVYLDEPTPGPTITRAQKNARPWTMSILLAEFGLVGLLGVITSSVPLLTAPLVLLVPLLPYTISMRNASDQALAKFAATVTIESTAKGTTVHLPWTRVITQAVVCDHDSTAQAWDEAFSELS